MTIGAILAMKAMFDLALNDRIEMWLLDRRIAAYWNKKNRDAAQRDKIRQSMTAFNPLQAQYVPLPPAPPEESRVQPSFLAQIEQ
jgi:hypothetical protein